MAHLSWQSWTVGTTNTVSIRTGPKTVLVAKHSLLRSSSSTLMSCRVRVSQTTPAASPLLQFSSLRWGQSAMVDSLPMHCTWSIENRSVLACFATVAALALLKRSSLQATWAASIFHPSSQIGFPLNSKIPSDCELPTRVRASGSEEEERRSTGKSVRASDQAQWLGPDTASGSLNLLSSEK